MSRRDKMEEAHRAAARAFVGSMALLVASLAFAAEPDLARARELVQAAESKPPEGVAAHLELGRAYYVLGRYAEAKIEFETVLRFDSLPQDLLSQVEVYNRAASQALDEKRAVVGFGYAETGIGRYHVNPTRGTDASAAAIAATPSSTPVRAAA